jgi:hypothetical protein
MWLEVEGPFCWEHGSNDPSHRAATVRQIAEMILLFRNDPSVLMWSLANESKWGTNFDLAARIARKLDPTRPFGFNWGGNQFRRSQKSSPENGHTQIAIYHYPGLAGAQTAREHPERPLYFGEWCHLNAYNRRELMTDPGLRNRWGVYLERLWDTMWKEPNVLGGSIWSGIDDTFFLDDDLTVGYGAWGPIDGWRRPKPEWWNVKKVYSPVHLLNRQSVSWDKGSVVLDVENRHDFLDFDQLDIRWELADHKGVAKTSLPARQRGQVVLSGVPRPEPGEILTIRFTDPRGVVLNRFAFPLGKKPVVKTTLPAPEAAESDNAIEVRQGNMLVRIDKMTGAVQASRDGKPVITAGPHLMLLPLNKEGNTQMHGETKHFEAFNPICTGWKCDKVAVAHPSPETIVVTVSGAYAEAAGSYRWTFSAAHPPQLAYGFTLKKSVNPRQVGVVFDLPKGFDRLAWKRAGQWSAYPTDHIGRLEGTALAHPPGALEATEIGPRQNPGSEAYRGASLRLASQDHSGRQQAGGLRHMLPWSSDHTCYGSNDFRSTKENIRLGRVSAGADGPGLTLLPADAESPLHLRAWTDPATGATRVLAASYTNGGAERFLRRLSKTDDTPLKNGDPVKGRLKIML